MSENSIIKEFEEYKGQFVINDNWEVVRLIAVGDDGWDYCWVYWDGRKMSWSSCVGGFVPLKGKIDEKDYKKFVREAYMNHYDLIGLNREDDETTTLMLKVMRDRTKMEAIKRKNPKDEYITKICWELT